MPNSPSAVSDQPSTPRPDLDRPRTAEARSLRPRTPFPLVLNPETPSPRRLVPTTPVPSSCASPTTPCWPLLVPRIAFSPLPSTSFLNVGMTVVPGLQDAGCYGGSAGQRPADARTWAD